MSAASGDGIPGSPRDTANFAVPSPLPTRRTRTYSMNQRADDSKLCYGTVQSFCRQKGHGFITPTDGGDVLFFHISDIDEEYVPKPRDGVTFKKILIPPKNEKYSAVHVKITHMAEGESHERWEMGMGKGTSPS